MAEVILPWPPSVNSYWRTVAGRMITSKAGREYRAAVCAQVEEQKTEQFASKDIAVEIEAFRPDKRRRDLDNLLKAVLDALCYAGVYDDDSQIQKLTICWGPHIGGYLKVRIRAWSSGSIS